MPYTSQQIVDAVAAAEEAMKPYRAHQRAMEKRLVGRHYGSAGGDPRYSNLILEAQKTIVPRITREEFSPKATAKLPVIQNGPLVQAAVSHLIKHAGVAQVHARAVMSALLGPFGVVRCGVRAGPDNVALAGLGNTTAGRWYCKNVSNHDFGIDPSATCRDEIGFAYDGYWMDMEAALASGYYDNAALEKAPSLENSSDEPNELGNSGKGSENPFRKKVRLMNFYARDHNGNWSVCVHAMERNGEVHKDPVRQEERFSGPPCGPYKFFTFIDPIDQLYGLSVAAQIDDIDTADAETSRNIVDAVKALKPVFIAEPGSQEMVSRITRAKHFGVVFGNPKSIARMDVGGAIPEQFTGIEYIKSLFNNATGGGQLLSGSKDVSKTATAAAFLQQNAANYIEAVQERSQKFAASIVEDAAFVLLNDPFVKLPLTYRPEGGEDVLVLYDGAAIKNNAGDYLWDVEPFSSLPTDANSRMARMMEVLDKAIQGSMALSQMGGDVQEFLEMLAEEADLPRLRSLFPTPRGQMVMQSMMQGLAQSQPQQPSMQRYAQGGRPIDQVRSDLAPTTPRAPVAARPVGV